MGVRTTVAQTYRGVHIEETEQPAWEVHCTLRLPDGDVRKEVFDNGKNFVDQLNKLGQEGWELAGVVDEKTGLFEHPQATTASSWIVKSFLFKRPVT